MSWSIEVTGTKLGAAKKVAEQMDKTAASYAGKPEGDDVLAVKARLLALIDATDLRSDGYTDWNVVIVKANGSHHAIGSLIGNASCQFSVTRGSVALDPA